MARTAVTVTSLSMDAGVDVKSATIATAIDATNGHKISTDGRTKRYLIHVKNTFAGAKVVTAKAPSSQVPAFRSGLGDKAVSVAASTGEQMLVLDAARFEQANGEIWLDIEASMTGTIAVYKLPDAL